MKITSFGILKSEITITIMKIKASFPYLLSLLFFLLPAFAGAETIPPSVPHYVVVVDNSGSMKATQASEPALDFLEAFMERLKPGNKTSIITFGSSSREIRNKTSNESINRELFSFDESYTDIQSGFLFTLDLLKREKNDGEQIFVIFLTDGSLDLVSQKNATFPESLLGKSDYTEVLSRYAPYIEGNSIQRDQIVAFSEAINAVGAEVFYQNVIPELKKEISPLFTLSFAEESPLLQQLSQHITLKGGMPNYSVLKNREDQKTYLNAFFTYSSGIMALREEKRIAQENARIEAEALREREKAMKESAVVAPPEEIVVEDVPEVLPVQDDSSLTQEEVFETPYQEPEPMVAQKEETDKNALTQELPKEEKSTIFLIVLFALLIVVVLFLLLRRKKEDEVKVEAEVEVAKEAPIGEPSTMSKQVQDDFKEFALNMESSRAETKEVDTPEELKEELNKLDGEELTRRLQELDDFQRKSLEESDEYLREFMQRLGNQKGFDFSSKLSNREGRINFRHKISTGYSLNFIFMTEDLRFEGRVHNISEGGLGMTAFNMPKDKGLKRSKMGTIMLRHRNRRIKLAPVMISHVNLKSGILGVTLKGLKEDPDMKLIWLETFSRVIDDIKEGNNE